jgi:glucosamine 6-phosphate synthetase-like amidotransferase/phosphosugar isomerase protein
MNESAATINTNAPLWTANLTKEQLETIESLRQKREEMLARMPEHRGKGLDAALIATRGQPQAIAATLKEEAENITEISKAIVSRNPTRIITLGCGDSWFNPLSIRFAYEAWTGLPFQVEQALEFARYYFKFANETTPVIALSSSGVVPRTLEALWIAQARKALTIAVTNRAQSPLDAAGDRSILVRAGRPGPPTQSSTAAMAALLLLALEVGRGRKNLTSEEYSALSSELHAIPAMMSAVIEEADEPMRQLAARLSSGTLYNYVGAGPSLGTAHFGYAKVREAAWVRSMPWQSEEYDHEVSHQLPAGEPVFLVAPMGESYDRNIEIARSVRRDNGFLTSIVDESDQEISKLSDVAIRMPHISEYLSPLLYVVPLQLFGMHLGVVNAQVSA